MDPAPAGRKRLTATDVIAVVGLGLLTWGAAWIYGPAGPIVAGSLLLAGAVFGATRK